MGKVRSFNVDPWSMKTMGWLLKTTTHRSKAELLIPGVFALATHVVELWSAAEKRGEISHEDGQILEAGRVLLREHARRNPGQVLGVAGGEK